MNKYALYSGLLSIILLALSTKETYSAKKFTRKTTASSSSKTATLPSTGAIPAVVRFSSDKHTILLSFSNFNGIESVNYSMSYSSNGIPEGVGGAIRQGNDPTTTRELYFGTCSHGVCTPHYNIQLARLTLLVRYTSGKTTSKTYRIKSYH